MGYTQFIKKAQISNDQALLRQLNTILQSNAITEGHNATAQEAIEDCEANGFVVTTSAVTCNEYGSVVTVTIAENSSATLAVKDGSAVDSLNVNSTSAKVDIESDAEVNSIVADNSENINQSAADRVMVLTATEKATITSSVNSAISDFGKIVGKVTTADTYSEEEYLTALSNAGITGVSLYFDTEYVVSGSVETVEIDGVTYQKDDTTTHSMDQKVYVKLNAFKIDATTNHPLIDKILYFYALVNNNTLKVNGERVPLKWDAYTASEQSLAASDFKFASVTDSGSYSINGDIVEVTYTGAYQCNPTGMFTFKYTNIVSGDIILWKKVEGESVKYSWDHTESGGYVGMYPFSSKDSKNYSKSETRTLYVFSSDGTFKGIVGPIDFEFNYYTGNCLRLIKRYTPLKLQGRIFLLLYKKAKLFRRFSLWRNFYFLRVLKLCITTSISSPLTNLKTASAAVSSIGSRVDLSFSEICDSTKSTSSIGVSLPVPMRIRGKFSVESIPTMLRMPL